MSKIPTKISIIILLAVLYTACSTVKKVPTNKYLLVKNTLEVDGAKFKTNEDGIIEQINQQPNTSILGFNFRLHLYNLAKEHTDSLFKKNILDNPKKYKRLSKWLSEKQVHRLGKSFVYSGIHNFLKKTGEPPVLIDSLKTIRNAKNIEAWYQNQGYLRAKSSYKIKYLPNKKAHIEYFVKKGKPYILDTIHTDIANKSIDSLYKKVAIKSSIKQGKQYKESNFSNEINRLTQYFKNNGIYDFQQQDIEFEIDTANYKTPVTIKITDRKIKKGDSIITKPYEIRKIGKININIVNKPKKGFFIKEVKDSINYKNYHFYSNEKIRHRAKAITNAIFTQKDSVFSDLNRTQTLRSLSNLRVFNFPNITFTENPKDKTLTTEITLIPKERFSFRVSGDFTHSNIQDFGITGNTSVLINNIFRGAEILEIGIKGNLGSSKDFANPKKLFFNIQEYGADLKLSFPRIFFPLNTKNIIPKYMFPSTLISAGFSKQLNIGLDKESITGAINYSWTPSSKTNFKLDLTNLQYIKNININNYFNVYTSSYDQLNQLAKIYNLYPELLDDQNNLSIEKDGADLFIRNALEGVYPKLNNNEQDFRTIQSISERKKRLTENNLILSSNISYNKTSQTDISDKDFYSIRTKLESTGNIMSLIADITKRPRNTNGNRNILGLEYSQYIKGELEYIKHWDLKNEISIAFRAFGGLAIPYGNSNSIPFTRSYFAGGANDNRAWQSYSLGPGNSNSINDFNEANMKLSFNGEIRFNILGQHHGALFADCGNIWNANIGKAYEIDEKKVFNHFSSLEGLALGTGIGYRYDFNFFVLRLDWGFKTYSPTLDKGSRWFTDFNVNKSQFNIGINYPF
ncbi:outer membrane protein assembly factor [Flavobacterium columnare]|uniref:Outer membrane protein assembly factor n=1 Tax=Flavobacterium columnare TaxID=996 RepID=A0A437UCL9_9FLAO|nr:BamA/TamA family outer membrane protein [Flavobacterium columnare]RVU91362.1 outer membrane protein assembly factor [Flavobacterium columnare]